MKTPRRLLAAMTLIELMVSVSVLAISMGGILAALIQSRRLTEGSVVQSSALTIVQGYIEQMKNMELSELLGGAVDAQGKPALAAGAYDLPTRMDVGTADPIRRSTGAIPPLTAFVPGTTPSVLYPGIADNLKKFDVARDATASTSDSSDSSSEAATAQVPWNTVWPGAAAYPSGNVGRTDLKINLWTWIEDLSGTAASAQKVYGITVVYTWQYLDGGRPKYVVGTVRAIRSSVPTF